MSSSSIASICFCIRYNCGQLLFSSINDDKSSKDECFFWVKIFHVRYFWASLLSISLEYFSASLILSFLIAFKAFSSFFTWLELSFSALHTEIFAKLMAMQSINTLNVSCIYFMLVLKCLPLQNILCKNCFTNTIGFKIIFWSEKNVFRCFYGFSYPFYSKRRGWL